MRFSRIELLQSVEDVHTERGASSLKGAFLADQGYVIEPVDGQPFFEVYRESDPTRRVWISVHNVKRAVPVGGASEAKWPQNARVKKTGT